MTVRLVVPAAILAVALIGVAALVVWYRPMVACGFTVSRTGHVATTYCRADQPVWP